MIDATRLEELDGLLNELDRLAESELSASRFYVAVLERLRFVLSSGGAAYLVPVLRDRWNCVAASGTIDAAAICDGLGHPASGANCKVLDSGHTLIVPLPGRPEQGGVIAVALAVTLGEAAQEELIRLCQAFGELIESRELAGLRAFLREQWPRWQQLLVAISRADSLAESATVLVNDLQWILDADRVSVARPTLQRSAKVEAVSGAVGVLKRSRTIESIERLCRQAIEARAAQVHPAAAAEDSQGASQVAAVEGGDILKHYVALPLIAPIGGADPPVAAGLLVEWQDRERFIRGTSRINLVVPALAVVWTEQARWLAVPRGLRRLVSALHGQRPRVGGRLVVRYGVPLLAALLLGWWLLWPAELRIEMEGTLEPAAQRTVFAALDGIIDQVLVSDNAAVKRGQVLVEMRSPQLELLIEEAAGDWKANAEKLAAVMVSVNQLSRNQGATSATINRLSAEIRQLEAQRDLLQSRLAALQQEQQLLRVCSPIDGLLIARDLTSQLQSRPVRRGDALFRVVDPSDDWRLSLLIADRDVGYVKRRLAEETAAEPAKAWPRPSRAIEFVLAAKPDRRFQGELEWLAEVGRNPKGDGVFVEARASIDPRAVEFGHVGATVHAYFHGGTRPTWFVWSRPLVEAIQRKLWF